MKTYIVWKKTQDGIDNFQYIEATTRGKAKSYYMKEYGVKNYLNIDAVRWYEE